MNSADVARGRTPGARPGGFDVAAFFAAIDERRQAEGLSWPGLAVAVWEMSSGLVARKGGHPISGSTIQNMQRRGGTCQHALLVLWWLDRAPEEFVVRPRPATTGVPLPDCDPDHRLRWNLADLYAALDDARTERGATWPQVATRLHCTANQLTGLRTAKYATNMRLAMRITQSLQRPAADFIEAATW